MIKLTRKHWGRAGINDKDIRSRVIAKIKRECPSIRLDTKQGRCTYIEFDRLGWEAILPVPVEQAASDQLTLHLAKLLVDLAPLGSVLTLVLGELPMTKVRRRDPRLTLFGLYISVGTAMQSAPAVLFVSRTLTRGAPTCLRPTSLAWPVRSEPPLDTDGHVVFCKHE